MSHLRTFGSKVRFLHKLRSKKLKKMDNVGRFMTYKGTNKIVYVIDDVSGKERTTTHVNYDEAFTSVPTAQQPPMTVALQQSGYTPEKETSCQVNIKLLHPKARLPERATVEAACLDIYTPESIHVKSGQQEVVPTGIEIELPPGYHAEVKIRSCLAHKYRARVEAGVIDSDYRGHIFVIMSNSGTEDISIQQGERIAQLLIIQDPHVTFKVTHELSNTTRNSGKFGSTGTKDILRQQDTTATAAHLHDDAEMVDLKSHTNVELSHDPFMDAQTIVFPSLGKHPTQGLVLTQDSEWDNTVNIAKCKPGTASAKIPNWTKRLKNSVLLEINHHPITTTDQATKLLSNKPQGTPIQIKVGLQEKISMHNDGGIPMMYFDQLQYILDHLSQIKQQKHNQTLN